MYNNWGFQQQNALQYAFLMQQQQQYMLPQMLAATNSPVMYYPTPPTSLVSVPRVPVRETNADTDEEAEPKRTLFCANLDERVTEDILYEVFLQAGPIDSARIPKDSNGRQRTFGFVTYVHARSLPYALRLFHGLKLFRKQLVIKYQENKSGPSHQQEHRDHHRSQSNIDYESRRRSGGHNRNTDNNSLRNRNLVDLKNEQSATSNPFRRELCSTENPFKQEERSELQNVRSGKERIWSRQNTGQYQRHGNEKDIYDRNRGKHDNDYQRRNQRTGSNRPSDQRQSNHHKNKSSSRR